MDQSKTPVIILDVEQRSQEGIVQAFGQRGIPIVAISKTHDCPVYHSRYVSQRFRSPDPVDNEMEYIKFLVELPVRGVLVYSTDFNSMVISRHQDQLRSAGYLLNLPQFDVLNRLFDKWKCYQLADSLGIPVAKSQIVESFEDIEAIWDGFKKPVILKGTTLAGGMYAKFDRLDEAGRHLEWIESIVNSRTYGAHGSRIILQEWLEYGPRDVWCCETVYDGHSRPVGFFTVRKIQPSLSADGTYTSRLLAGEHIPQTELVDMVETLLTHMKWRGFAHVDCVFVPAEEKFYLTEVNPRLPGFSSFPTKAGFDMAYYYYADLVGASYNVPKTFNYSVYFESLRYPGDLSEAILYIWRGHVRVGTFLSNYRKLATRNATRVIEPVRIDDLAFTLHSLLQSFRTFVYDVKRFAVKRVSRSTLWLSRRWR